MKFISSQPIPYTRFDSLVDNDCESGLRESSVEESKSNIKNEKSGEKCSDDDCLEYFMIICSISLFVIFSYFLVMFRVHFHQLNDTTVLINFSPILLLILITLRIVICKNRKSNVHLLEVWQERKQVYITHDV